MSGITDDDFRGGNSYVFTSPFRFSFSEDHAVPLKKMKGEGMSQVIYFFLIPRIGLFFVRRKILFLFFPFSVEEQNYKNKAKSSHSFPSFTGGKKITSTSA